MDNADLLVVGTLVAMDVKGRVIEDGAVATRDGSIVAIGERDDMEARYQVRKTIDASGALVLSGLINRHAHAAMSLFRGFSDDHSLQLSGARGPESFDRIY